MLFLLQMIVTIITIVSSDTSIASSIFRGTFEGWRTWRNQQRPCARCLNHIASQSINSDVRLDLRLSGVDRSHRDLGRVSRSLRFRARFFSFRFVEVSVFRGEGLQKATVLWQREPVVHEFAMMCCACICLMSGSTGDENRLMYALKAWFVFEPEIASVCIPRNQRRHMV